MIGPAELCRPPLELALSTAVVVALRGERVDELCYVFAAGFAPAEVPAFW